MPGIQVLPVYLVNMIAAGEVVERPASVVKELVENALDAGASRIDVVVEDGGRQLIQVTDDGVGMSPDDLALAFRPHATSKITGEDDLAAIETMGFRGEALASIASISHARIQTRRREDDGGHEATAAGEEIGPVRPCAAAPGTTVTIRDLFFNTPARRKFMRTSNTELGHISEQLARLALPYPQVAFTLTHNGRKVRELPATDATRQRAADLFGQDLADTLLPVVQRKGAVQVAGLVAPPAGARASGKWQYFFLNGRYVRDRLLGHALREAFRGRVDPNRWPVALLFLRVPPEDVDVNVHPTKVEVRFRNGQLVHGELLAALRETLNRADISPDAVVTSVEPLPKPPLAAAPDTPEAGKENSEANEERRASLREALADFFKSVPPTQPRLSFPEPQVPHRPSGTYAPTPPPGPLPGERPAPASSPAPSETPPSVPSPLPPARRAIQVHDSYIVAATDDGLAIIDQHALHERVLYNEFHRRLTDGPLTGQRLLIPATFAATDAETDALTCHQDLLARLGIETAPFGPDTVAVQQFPTLLADRGVAPADFVRELLDRLADDETADPERLLEDVLAMMSCKAAVKAGDPLTADEIDALLAKAETLEKASACPHGRPTTLRMTLKDLEKQFRRI